MQLVTTTWEIEIQVPHSISSALRVKRGRFPCSLAKMGQVLSKVFCPIRLPFAWFFLSKEQAFIRAIFYLYLLAFPRCRLI